MCGITAYLGAKQAAWLVHCAVVGAVIAPICLLGGAVLTRAAWYTAGTPGGRGQLGVVSLVSLVLYQIVFRMLDQKIGVGVASTQLLSQAWWAV